MTIFARIMMWIIYSMIVNSMGYSIFTAKGFILFIWVCIMLSFESYVGSQTSK